MAVWLQVTVRGRGVGIRLIGCTPALSVTQKLISLHSCVCSGDAVSNPAVDVEGSLSPVDDSPAGSPVVTFVSNFDNDDENLAEAGCDEIPLVGETNADSVCTLTRVDRFCCKRGVSG